MYMKSLQRKIVAVAILQQNKWSRPVKIKTIQNGTRKNVKND